MAKIIEPNEEKNHLTSLKTILKDVFPDANLFTTLDGQIEIERAIAKVKTFVKKRTKVLEKQLKEREQAAIALKASETRYRRLFESAKDGILILDAETGQIVDVNPFLIDILGYSHEELLGRKLWEIGPFKDILESKENFAELQSQGYLRYEDMPLKTANGRSINVEFVSNVYLVDQTKVIQCTIRDITQRKRAEEEIEKSKDLYKAFFEDDLTGDFIATADGKLMDCNPAYLKMLNFRNKEQALGFDLKKLYPQMADRQKLIKLVKKHGRLEDYEYTLMRMDKKLVYVISNIIGSFDEKGKLKTIKGYLFDNTKRKLAEKELIKLSRAVEQNTAAIVITDLEGDIEYVNPQFTEVTGYRMDEVIGKNPRILKSGFTSPEEYKTLWKNITSGNEWRGEFRNRKKNGDLYIESSSICPITDEQGNITHFLAVKEDITEKKQMICDLIASKEKAEESDRLKSAFLMNMSHEIRTPMNGILGFLGLLNEPDLEEESKRKYIDIVNKSGQRLLDTINDIIEISKIEAGELILNFEEVDIEETMQFHLDFFKLQADEKGLNLKNAGQITGASALVQTDRHKLDGILTNLIKNAIKFTTQGSIEVGNYIKNDFMVFYVKDSGNGIPSDRLDAIFERFIQADLDLTRGYEGSGLGLSIAKYFVEALGGEIRVQSEVGKGSTFSFSIPYKMGTP
jgi:PAS domain S-box-containing protein